MSKGLKVLFTASEVAPYAKTGGLADVAKALPKALNKLGCEVIVVMPRYYQIDRAKLEKLPFALGIPMGSLGTKWAGVYKSTLEDSTVPIYFIDYEEYFGRAKLYTDDNGFSYSDNDIRFSLLSKASFELAKAIGFKPDIIHANDWHTAIQPILRDTRYSQEPNFRESATILTIHNLQHQGVFGKRIIDILEIGWKHFNPFELEALGAVNLLKGGIALSDRFTTVSPTYAKEIQTPEFGFGLDEHIRAHSSRLRGILNGVDYSEWSPAIDKFIPANYDIDDLEGKWICKEELQKRFLLPVDKNTPVVGFVGRFAEQKGISLIAEAMPQLLNLNAQFIFLGSGEKWAEAFFSDIAKKNPTKFASYIGYSNELSHLIEAGSDMFLMPSIFEPCGLNQIYSLRYGTLPIVRAVGGLDDTIENYDANSKSGNGFKFWEASSRALFNTVKWALDTYYQKPEDIAILRDRGMRERFSWERSAKEYIEVYKEAINYRRGK